MKFDTKLIRAGIKPDSGTGAIVPPIFETATYVLERIGKDKGFDYTRSSNPTRETLEKNLAAIHGGKYGIVFASGMSAIDACLKLLKKGDHAVVTDDVYGGVYRLFNQILTKQGLRFTFVDTTNPKKTERAVRKNTRMLWVETPTNPLLKITDLHVMRKIARLHKLIYVVDSTFATPVFLRPLEFGADVVVESTTKYLSGHNLTIGGALVTNRKNIFDKMKFIQKSIGAVQSPFDAWLTLVGIKTLALRMARHTKNAEAVAEFLERHPKVLHVRYPGLTSHPNYQIALKQMSGFGGMISFELKGGIAAAKRVMNSVKLCSLAESLGSVETMITHPATMTHAAVPRKERLLRGLTDGLVRLSVGIEDVDDIIFDLNRAFRNA